MEPSVNIPALLFLFRNYDRAKEATHKSGVIARSDTTKQSVPAAWEIATGLRPRNDSRITWYLNNSPLP